MNTSKLADIAEITSSIAILVTLVFLVIQMQQNTDAIEAQSRSTTFVGTQERLAQYLANPDVQLPEYNLELSDEDKVRLHWTKTMFMQARQYDWFQYQSGTLDEAAWLAYTVPIQEVLATPNGRSWWKFARREYDLQFAEYIDSVIADIPVRTNFPLLVAFD